MAMKVCISVLGALGLLAVCCCSQQPKRVPREVALERLQKLGLEYNQNAFVGTAATGDLDKLSLYLDAGVDPNGEDDNYTTALYAAASSGSYEAIRLLVARGADPKRRTRSKDRVPLVIGWTPLGVATVIGSVATVKALLESGADPNELDRLGNPPAWYAIAPQAVDESFLVRLRYTKPAVGCLRALLDAGADANARDSDGNTLLMRAVAKSGVETTALLIEKGANPNEPGKDGKTAKQLAQERGDPRMLALIEKAGG